MCVRVPWGASVFTLTGWLGACVGLCPAIIRQDPVPLVLGYALRELFVCTGTPSPSTCVSDNFRCNDTRVPQRVGMGALSPRLHPHVHICVSVCVCVCAYSEGGRDCRHTDAVAAARHTDSHVCMWVGGWVHR
jgi:hypothetical protein